MESECCRCAISFKNSDQIVEAFVKAITPKTKFALIDHITSATGIIFPIEKIIAEMHARGIEVLVDAAHSPGHVELNLEKLGAEYFVGNCHKWICSPKGSAILYVREDKQKLIEPLQISHFLTHLFLKIKNGKENFSGRAQMITRPIVVWEIRLISLRITLRMVGKALEKVI